MENRDFRIQGFTRQASYSNGVEFIHHNPAGPMRVHGMILFGIEPGKSKIVQLNFGNFCMAMDPIPAEAFAREDIATFDDAQQYLERKSTVLLKRQGFQGIVDTTAVIRMTVDGPCTGAAMYCEYIAMPHLPQRQVRVAKDGMGNWSGRITEDTLLGQCQTLNIEAPTEDAVMQGIIAGLGGLRVRVG